jgi:peptide/nickel transport system substrate-binding protein
VGKTYNRRQFLAHSAATAGGVVAAGSVVDQLAGMTPAGAVTPGGTLNVGVISEQNTPFVPDYATMDTTGFNYARAIYDPLCVVSADGSTVYPYLAKSVTHNSGYDEWTITARPDIKFHNGAPCDGDAIYDNLVADYNSALTGAAIKGLITDFTHKKGSSTVTVKTAHKWVTFPYTLSEQQIGFMAAPDTLGSGGKPPKPGTNPVGTGPFIFSKWDYNTSFQTVRNANYWRNPGTLPYLDELIFYPVPDSGTRLQGLQDGTYDLIIEGDSPTILSMQSLGGGYNVITDLPSVPTGYTPVYNPSVGCVMLNLRKAPFTNLDLRKACAYAIDRTQFVGVIDDNVSAPVNGIYPPNSPYYKHPSYPPVAGDIATAKALVAKVPKNERSFTMGYVTMDPTILSAAVYIQNALKKVGIKVTLKPVSQGNLILDAIEHNFEALLWAQFGGVSADLNYPWFSTASGPLNFAGNFDKKIQSDMLAGMAATTASGREAAWGAVNNKLDVDLPYIWLDRAVLAVGAKSNVMNWQTFTEPSVAAHPVLQPNQAVLFFTETWKS